jgi:hypothetical protein
MVMRERTISHMVLMTVCSCFLGIGGFLCCFLHGKPYLNGIEFGLLLLLGNPIAGGLFTAWCEYICRFIYLCQNGARHKWKVWSQPERIGLACFCPVPILYFVTLFIVGLITLVYLVCVRYIYKFLRLERDSVIPLWIYKLANIVIREKEALLHV